MFVSMMDYLDVKRDDLNYMHLYRDATGLMDNAARQIAEFVRTTFGSGIRVCAVCGTGNNGGDGIAALEHLRSEDDVTVILVRGKNSLKTTEAKWALKNYGGKIAGIRSLEKELRESDVVLDCIFGIGISGDPREPYSTTIKKMNRIGRNIVSVDVPSGLGTSIAVKPAHTVTFTDVKRGMKKENSGNIVVRDIGIPEAVSKYAGPGDMVYYTEPESESHKGMNGTLAIVGGWEFYGSSVIAGTGANAFGNDLVRIYVSEKNYEIISSFSPYLIVRNINSMKSDWIKEVLKSRAVLVGPGLGQSQESKKAALSVIRSHTGPIVVDADGIGMISGNLAAIKGKDVIFTPHSREFETLTGSPATEENAVKFARKHSAVIVLKGKEDIVTDGTRIIHVQGGNARMTMGGTGDLLAGLISAAASRGIEPFRSAVMGAYVNKKAGEYSYRQKSYWYGIDDMISSIPQIMMDNIQWAATL